jgi:hypothetical protein
MRLTLGRTAPKPAEAPPAAGTLARLRPAIARWVPAVARSVPLSLAAFAIFAALLLLPSLLLGVNQTDSSAYNYVWAKQFAGLTRSGQVYPRWLPDSFGGLGSPAFVFYPPLAFFLDALVNIFTLDAMPVPYRLALTSTLLLWLSGAAMQAWLRGAVRPAVAFAAALAYMAAPFHMTDHYWRGAFAEFSFFAVLPFLPLAISVAAREWRGVAGVALSFALLILAHLPTALLTAITVLPIYTLYAAARRGRLRPAILALLRCGVGVALGLGLAAIYLVPALTLQGSIASQYLWDRYHSPEPWLLLHVAQWPSPQFMAMLASFAAAVAVLSAGPGPDPPGLGPATARRHRLGRHRPRVHPAHGGRCPAFLDGGAVRGQGAVPLAPLGGRGIRRRHRLRDGSRPDVAAPHGRAEPRGARGGAAGPGSADGA